MGLEHPLGERPLGRYPLGVSKDVNALAGVLDIMPAGIRDTAATGSYTTTAEYIADIFGWGEGGTGASATPTAYGGGGAAAGYSRLRLPVFTKIDWSVAPPRRGAASGGSSGSDGVDTVITLPGGVELRAQGGRRGTTAAAAGRAIATGFQVNRYGGGSGEAGEFGGGAGGAGVTNGGGAGGFRDLFPGLTGGDGYQGIGSGNGADYFPGYGGGGGAADGTNFSTWGGPGRVLILLYRI